MDLGCFPGVSTKKGELPWELKLELIADSTNRWGYLALISMSNADPIGLDLNIIDRRVPQRCF
jgi:hypothetical protein